MPAQRDYMQVLSMPVETVSCSSESRELSAPILKGEFARDNWLIWESWSTSKDLFGSVHPCQTDCMCGLGLSCTLPRGLWVSKPRDTHIRRGQNQKLWRNSERWWLLAPPGRCWLGISEMEEGEGLGRKWFFLHSSTWPCSLCYNPVQVKED